MAEKLGMKKEHFMSIVGFYGNTALVDTKLARRVKRMKVQALIEEGLLFQAVSAAAFDFVSNNIDEGQKLLCEALRVDTFATLIRRFGVHEALLRDEGAYRIKCI